MNIVNQIPSSELILHPDGSVYHIKIRPEHLANTVILVGDPQRVEIVSGFFDTIEFKGKNREIHTHTGYLNKKRITVMSTGMGTDNIDIVLNELDALVNIDLKLRTPKSQHTTLDIIRIGTSGAIQSNIPLDAFVLSEYGLGLDGLMYFYENGPAVINTELVNAFMEHVLWPPHKQRPYVVSSSQKLAKKFNENVIRGITVTAPGFYGPQGRTLRLSPAFKGLIDKMETFVFKNKKILNFEMETSALYGLSKLLGHQALTICVAIANRKKQIYNQDYSKSIKNLIKLVLEKLTV